jgi:hypothetical protein
LNELAWVKPVWADRTLAGETGEEDCTEPVVMGAMRGPLPRMVVMEALSHAPWAWVRVALTK